MFSIEFEAAEEEKDLLIAELWELGCQGVMEETAAGGHVTLRAFFEGARERVAGSFAARHPRVLQHEAHDWVATSRSLLQPITVGERFFLVPEWRDDPAPEGRMKIVINPGMACGTGAHESTRICLRAMESDLRPGMTVVDVGAGSGILSIAAALLGAGRVIACDEDPLAVEIAAGNFQRAGVRVELFAGSIGALRDVRAGLILANISAAASIALVRDMMRCGALCVAGGFEAQEEASVREAIHAAGGLIREVLAENAWRAIVYLPASGGTENAPRSSSSRTATLRTSSSS